MRNALLLLSIEYSGEYNKAVVKLYNPEKGSIELWYDNKGHKPYLLTDLDPETIVKEYPQVIQHRGFDHLELVKKYDPLRDRELLMTKVVATDPLSIGGGRNAIRDMLPRTWESKIKYHLCYTYDNSIIPGMWYRLVNGNLKLVDVEVPPEIVKLVEKLYQDPEVRKSALHWAKLLHAPIPDIRRIAVDIEVYTPVRDRIPNPREARYQVIAISLSSTDGLKKVMLLRRRGAGEEKPRMSKGVELEYYDDEKAMLKRAFDILKEYPLILTFNGDNFDMNYLSHRAKLLGIPDNEIPISIVYTGQAGQVRARVDPGVHIDLYHFFNNHAMQVYAFKNKYRETKTLDAIAKALLGVGKIKLNKNVSELSYLELAQYCYRDAELTLKLTTFDNNIVLRLMILLMRISKLPIDDIVRTGISQWIKNMLYFEHRRMNWLIPEPSDIRRLKGSTKTKAIIKGKKYLGAIVIDPLPGVFFNVMVVDFASLYPSVIKKWNISYETLNCPHIECKNNVVPGTPHWICTKRRGITSGLISFLRDFRIEIYKPLSKTPELSEIERESYEVIQQALKVFINASYGVFGHEKFPLYCPPAAECTTALGRYAITKTLRRAHDLGITVLYGDTDSLFLWRPPPDKLDELLRWSEEVLGIDLDIDKVYKFVVFSGRKKNYLGVTSEGILDIKGLVGKKRHVPEFIKDLFLQVSNYISKVESVSDLMEVKKIIHDIAKDSYIKLKKRKYTLSELAFRVALTKDPKEYVKSTPQHVKAARLLERYGIRPRAGDIVSFVKVRGGIGVKPVQLARIDEIDEEKYLPHIETTFRQILEAMGVDFNEILGRRFLESQLFNPP